MKFTHTVKFPLGKRYEMREFSMEMEDAEFPELRDLPFTMRVRFMQGTLLHMALVFQAASGYISPESEDFMEQLRLALELKKIPAITRKVSTSKPADHIDFTASPIPEEDK